MGMFDEISQRESDEQDRRYKAEAKAASYKRMLIKHGIDPETGEMATPERMEKLRRNQDRANRSWRYITMAARREFASGQRGTSLAEYSRYLNTGEEPDWMKEMSNAVQPDHDH